MEIRIAQIDVETWMIYLDIPHYILHKVTSEGTCKTYSAIQTKQQHSTRENSEILTETIAKETEGKVEP